MSPIKNKTIFKNTVMLYLRQIVIMLVNLSIVRVLLEQLGVEDYGIYNVIGGIVGLFTFVNASMASATQRYFSFALGRNDKKRLYQTFSVNLLLYTGFAVLLFVLLETIGLWYVKNELIIPADRAVASDLLYHFSSLTFVMSMITTPFIAIIIAHEDMRLYAYISIVESILKLCVVLALSLFIFNKLEIYGVLLLGVSLIVGLIYLIVCLKKYDECQFSKIYWDVFLFKDVLVYTGWAMFGQATTVARNQAITILMNQIFNPVLVAARAISINVSTALSTFSNNFNVGLYPPIIKSYASGDYIGMYNLIFRGSKITFFLMWILSLPLLIETQHILNLWLKDVPRFAVIFTQLSIVEVLINSISLPLITAARAPGKMKVYELSLGIIQILIFFVSWFFLKLGYAAPIIYYIAIIANIIMLVVRLFIIKYLMDFPILTFSINVILPICITSVISFIVSFALKSTFFIEHYSFILSMFIVFFINLVCVLCFGINKQERIFIKDFIVSKINIKHL